MPASGSPPQTAADEYRAAYADYVRRSHEWEVRRAAELGCSHADLPLVESAQWSARNPAPTPPASWREAGERRFEQRSGERIAATIEKHAARVAEWRAIRDDPDATARAPWAKLQHERAERELRFAKEDLASARQRAQLAHVRHRRAVRREAGAAPARTAPRPRGAGRPRVRRTAASSRTSGTDPGSDPPPLALAPPPRAIYTYGTLPPEARGEHGPPDRVAVLEAERVELLDQIAKLEEIIGRDTCALVLLGVVS